MLTIMIHAKIKAELLDEYIDLIKMLSRETAKKGCTFYKFNQNRDDPTDFVLYEQWESQAALDVHMKELFELLGPAKEGEPIPHKLMKMYEKAVPVFYDVVGE
ncbi:MAG: antibiotic biosynthesis monooxygenase [Gammaproteobacteria bacterium]|nr:antibiotic biosynthesis monooxygenase [Gammaproteobacteria bacterium]